MTAGWTKIDDYIADHLVPADDADSGLSATAIQTVGEKGWDGVLLAIVEQRP